MRPDRVMVKTRLVVQNFDDGADICLEAAHLGHVLRLAIKKVLELLYEDASDAPPIRSVTLFLEPMEGVAYTKGSDLDDDHKEIHLSTKYIQNVGNRARNEILGVVNHEMVHCLQWNGSGTCPSPLIEGIADWVRLRSGLTPPHWKRGGERWDEGYQNTAYFLDWLAQGDAGIVRKMNLSMRFDKYDEKTFWKRLAGADVQTLWAQYRKEVGLLPFRNPQPTHSPKKT